MHIDAIDSYYMLWFPFGNLCIRMLGAMDCISQTSRRSQRSSRCAGRGGRRSACRPGHPRRYEATELLLEHFQPFRPQVLGPLALYSSGCASGAKIKAFKSHGVFGAAHRRVVAEPRVAPNPLLAAAARLAVGSLDAQLFRQEPHDVVAQGPDPEARRLVIDRALQADDHQALALAFREALRRATGDLVAGHAAQGGAQRDAQGGTGGPGDQPVQEVGTQGVIHHLHLMMK